MRIYGVVSGFNEEAMIERCLRSLKPQVDVLIYVDGAYRKYPHKYPFSIDKTLDMVEGVADIIIKATEPWIDEVHKRNAYLLAEPGDLYVVLDADEELKGNVADSILKSSQSNSEQQDFRIDIHRKQLPIMSLVSRVFGHRRGIHYYGAHNALWADGVLLNHVEQPVLKECYIEHYRDERKAREIEDKGEYYRGLQKDEAEFRRKYRV